MKLTTFWKTILLKIFFWSAFVVTFIYLLEAVTNFIPHRFLFNDNWDQWLAVIDRAYESWFQGKIPFINPYQQLGIEINGVGYYSVLNPFMLIAYSTNKLLHWGSDTITVYIYLMFILGNTACFKLAKAYGLNTINSLFITLAYALVGQYIFQGHWYYVFNNFFIIPALLLTLLENSKLHWYGIALLALSFYMGNGQYAIWYVIIYILTYSTIIFYEKINRKILFKKLCVALIMVGILALPQISMSQSFARVSIDHWNIPSAQFFTDPVPIWKTILGLFVPESIYHQDIARINKPGSGYILSDMFFLGTLGWLALVGLIKMLYEQFFIFSHIKMGGIAKGSLSILVSSLILIIFLILTLAGRGYILADLLYHVPGIQNFRYLYKLMFLLPPLFILPACHSFVYHKKIVSTLLSSILIIGTSIGLVFSWQNIQQFSNSLAPYVRDPEILENTTMWANNFDTQNYRISGVLAASNVSDDATAMVQKLFKNVATYYKIFSPGGYQFLDENRYALIAPLHNGDKNISSMYNGALFIDDITKKPVTELAKITDTLISTSTKYLIFNKSSIDGKRFEEILNTTNTVKVAKKIPWQKNYEIYILEGVKPLAHNNQNEPLDWDASMNGFSIQKTTEQTQDVYLQFAYDEHYRCNFITTIKHDSCILNNQDGYILIKAPAGSGTIFVNYYDFRAYAALISIILIISLALNQMYSQIRKSLIVNA